jgi:hypothetical protein
MINRDDFNMPPSLNATRLQPNAFLTVTEVTGKETSNVVAAYQSQPLSHNRLSLFNNFPPLTRITLPSICFTRIRK